jgi:TM2 domain-containing membrane protein YozV/ribosomal protein L40E
MFCRNCGAQLSDQAAFCTGCGVGTGTGNKFCFNCGAQADPAASVCVKCGVALYGAPGSAAPGAAPGGYPPPAPGAYPPPPPGAYPPQAPGGYPPQVPGGYPGAPNPLKSKLVAGLLGIFVGGFGIHRFYLGYNTIGVIQILVTVVGGIITCGIGWIAGAIWGLVEGILILTGSINKDAQGRPLAE